MTPLFPLQLLILLFLLNLADIGLTLYGLSVGLVEANPIFYTAPFWVHLIIKTFLPLVFACCFLAAYMFCLKHKLNSAVKFLRILLVSLLVFYVAVVAWNITVLFVHLL